ncbi:MAG: sulfoxide reductase heme-binding subunit YedZ [Rhodospirillales bacterium]|nr:sulfoxide reductase heme-binding subunit YedZ [Rhodospirillales bacterium]
MPLAWLAWGWSTDGLGANPIEATTRFLGDWALRFLLIALGLTPVRIVTGWNGLARFRRMLGLFAFAYAMLHVFSYIGLDQFFAWRTIAAEIVKRTYITVGMLAVLCLIPLAVTSTKGMVRRLGAKRWQKLHRLAYVAGVAGVIHFYMMVKADVREPLIYGAILTALFAIRLWHSRKRDVGRQAKAQEA